MNAGSSSFPPNVSRGFTLVFYHLLEKTGWLTVVVNGTRRILSGNFHRDACTRSISTLMFRNSIQANEIQCFFILLHI